MQHHQDAQRKSLLQVRLDRLSGDLTRYAADPIGAITAGYNIIRGVDDGLIVHSDTKRRVWVTEGKQWYEVLEAAKIEKLSVISIDAM